ncbi:MAG TPA: CHRD domain-containing protein [Gemmatimonadales bacterium]|nr:CHRD domain-containing protein [Gemmatimonadales bacterium]
MTGRFPRLAATFVLGSITLAGCSSDDTSPVEVTTVRLAVIPGSEHGGLPFATDLTQEVFHHPTMTWTGDPDGTGTALITINLGQGELCWDVTVSGIGPLPASASHIHKQVVDWQGPIYIGLPVPDASGKVSGCMSEDRAKLKRIVQFPDSFYVNVHTAEFPTGAVRGQLGR